MRYRFTTVDNDHHHQHNYDTNVYYRNDVPRVYWSMRVELVGWVW